MTKGVRFASWVAVIHYCGIHPWVYYHAPLDTCSVVIAVRKVYKNGKIRLTAPSGYSFTADAGHLDRFSYPE